MDLAERAREAITLCGHQKPAEITCVVVDEGDGYAMAQARCIFCRELRSSSVQRGSVEAFVHGRCVLAGVFNTRNS